VNKLIHSPEPLQKEVKQELLAIIKKVEKREGVNYPLDESNKEESLNYRRVDSSNELPEF